MSKKLIYQNVSSMLVIHVWIGKGYITTYQCWSFKTWINSVHDYNNENYYFCCLNSCLKDVLTINYHWCTLIEVLFGDQIHYINIWFYMIAKAMIFHIFSDQGYIHSEVCLSRCICLSIYRITNRRISIKTNI